MKPTCSDPADVRRVAPNATGDSASASPSRVETVEPRGRETADLPFRFPIGQAAQRRDGGRGADPGQDRDGPPDGQRRFDLGSLSSWTLLIRRRRSSSSRGTPSGIRSRSITAVTLPSFSATSGTARSPMSDSAQIARWAAAPSSPVRSSQSRSGSSTGRLPGDAGPRGSRRRRYLRSQGPGVPTEAERVDRVLMRPTSDTFVPLDGSHNSQWPSAEPVASQRPSGEKLMAPNGTADSPETTHAESSDRSAKLGPSHRGGPWRASLPPARGRPRTSAGRLPSHAR